MPLYMSMELSIATCPIHNLTSVTRFLISTSKDSHIHMATTASAHMMILPVPVELIA